jgi:hypothetical protein
MSSRDKKVIKYHKPLILQIYGYLAIIPFCFAFLALMDDFQLVDLMIFSIGLTFVLALLLVNHLEPVVRVTEYKVILYNKFHNRPTTLLIDNYINYTLVNSRHIIVTFADVKYEIKLNRSDMKKFIIFLEEIN